MIDDNGDSGRCILAVLLSDCILSHRKKSNLVDFDVRKVVVYSFFSHFLVVPVEIK